LKIRGLVAVASAVALIVPAGFAFAQAAEVSKANGGGQILNEDQVSGAGDTIAFAVQDETTPTGQIQYVDRTGDGTGQGQTVSHGSPTCFRVEGSVAQIGVEWRDGTTSTLFVTDGGPSADSVTVAPGSTPDCDDDEPDETTALARGNVTVWDNQ
jgi:hypothetical protein